MSELSKSEPETIVRFALDAVGTAEAEKLAVLDRLPTPVYATDAEGLITYYNPACVGFAGRRPVKGVDRWCISYKLYAADGSDLPHDQCPMATAIREARPVRGIRAFAERPDGQRLAFEPFPTPILDTVGNVIGAVNLLIDPEHSGKAQQLRAQAERCRRLARGIDDLSTRDTLTLMAKDYEARAKSLTAA